MHLAEQSAEQARWLKDPVQKPAAAAAAAAAAAEVTCEISEETRPLLILPIWLLLLLLRLELYRWFSLQIRGVQRGTSEDLGGFAVVLLI
jgi:hypothetical protein